uniref:Na(+)/H(+) exchange regulatory cofactor NHE-RF n=1 Tax=Xiphophorus maculatus TaxID=8083 RepID=M4ACC7_XIPMA
MSNDDQYLRPRLCTLHKGDNGYGFHLHGEKGKTGQFIRLVEPDSPAESSGLCAGDRLVFVNGDEVESESHQQVVSRIRATAGPLELIVVDPETEQLLKKHNLKCLKEYVSEGLPLPLEEEEEEEEEGEEVTVEEEKELRPRLCVIQRGSNGYGFNLHSERARPGQYIRAVDDDSPAERAGLQPKDRIVEVNSVSVEGKTHSEVVGAIKAGGDVTRLLVVDPDTDAFFKRCRVTPTLEHLTGETTVNGRVPKERERERNSKLSVSPSPSNASSNASLTTPSAHTPPEGLVTNAIPGLNLTLQQVKELTHQKRSNKRAPPMDWTKKNELFSNL